jgi:hypothetical protein
MDPTVLVHWCGHEIGTKRKCWVHPRFRVTIDAQFLSADSCDRHLAETVDMITGGNTAAAVTVTYIPEVSGG